MSRSSSGGGNACLVIAIAGGCLVFLLAGFVVVAALLLPIAAQSRERARASSCLSNEKQQAMAVLLYVADYDERYPPSDGQRYREKIADYQSNPLVFECPSDENGPPSYSFNTKLSRLPLAKLKQPNSTVMIFEGAEWKKPDTPHLGSTNIAFADGSCRSLGPNLIEGQIWSPLQPAAKPAAP